MRLVSCSRKYQLILLIGFSLLIFYFNWRATDSIHAFTNYKTACDLETVKRIIENLCDLSSKSDQVQGNICAELCKKENDFTYFKQYELIDCYNMRPPKDGSGNMLFELYDQYKAVFTYELRTKQQNENEPAKVSKRLVLKSRNRYFFDFDANLDFDFNQKSIEKQLDYLIGYFEGTLASKFGIEIDPSARAWLEKYTKEPESVLAAGNRNFKNKDLIYYLKLFGTDNINVFLDALKNKNNLKMGNFIANLLILMSQDEYLFYRFFQAKPGVLKIHGTCGHFYMVEYAEPLTYTVRHMSSKDRKALALKFLDLFHALDTTYLTNEKPKSSSNLSASTAPLFIPIQMCDVKLDNFGLNEQNRLRIIDTDMAHADFFIFNKKVCNTHEDCHYFDCKSYCDTTTKRCLGSRVNNNLQALCEKIFNNTLLKEDGVLSGIKDWGSNIEHEINARLSACARPGFFGGAHDVPKKADQNLKNVFRVLLSDRATN